MAMASIGHWGMFPVDFAPAGVELRWAPDLGGFVISWIVETVRTMRVKA